jgi:hypothetical protein
MVESESYINDKGIKRWRYTRTCSCGEIVVTTYKPKEDTPCKKCNDKQLGKKMSEGNRKETHISYTYFCPTCPSIRTSRSRKKTPYCADCSRIESAKKRIGKERRRPITNFTRKVEVIIPKPRYFRICPDCHEDNNTIRVASALNAGIKPCRIHKKVPTGDDRRKKQVSQDAIDKVRALNKAHAEAVKHKEVIVKQTKTDDEMMTEFLENNKVTIAPDRDIEYSGGKMYIRESY